MAKDSLELKEIDLVNSTTFGLSVGERVGGELIKEIQLDGIIIIQVGGASSIQDRRVANSLR